LPCPRRCRRGGALLPQPFHPCLCSRREPSAVCSLWHFPWPRGPRPLAGTLPCGARTFLDALEERRGPHSPPDPSCQSVPRRGLEPPRRLRHQILSLACLPVSAPGQCKGCRTASRTVLPRGLEPPRACAHWILNPARLPIPPQERVVHDRHRLQAASAFRPSRRVHRPENRRSSEP
jgi:hypothetical protein